MNKMIPLMVMLAFAGGMTSCHKQKKTDVIIVPKQQPKKPRQTQSMGGYEQTREVEWLGSTYKVVVKRTADKSLPVLQLDGGNKYYDNRITVTILRADGTEFFRHEFLKTDFDGYIDDKSRQKGALLGVVFVEAAGDNLSFAASVGSPDITSDEYIPLCVKVSRIGKMAISKDTTLDTDNGEDGGNEKAPSRKDEADSDEDGV
jgi:hypothetical protein